MAEYPVDDTDVEMQGLLWQGIFNMGLPRYAGGVIGGLTALPLWEFLKRIGEKK